MEHITNITIGIPVVNKVAFKFSNPVKKEYNMYTAGDTSNKLQTLTVYPTMPGGGYPYTADRCVYPSELVFPYTYAGDRVWNT